jgi:peptidoglycan/xylan/chitin deacetylase (PgdA/CDA1 family)
VRQPGGYIPSAAGGPSRPKLSWLIPTVGLISALVVTLVGPAPREVHAAGQTIVSLTFDDGRASSYAARSLLSAHGMRATFYMISGKIGSSAAYLGWQQVKDLSGDGNEIGGHTVFHPDLTLVDAAEAQREVCYDRVNLINHGFQVTDFAYPNGAYNAALETTVRNCGYNSARSTTQAPVTETNPPQDPYAVRIGSGSNSLAALEWVVTRAEQNGGGWVPLLFHDICSGCSSASLSGADFTSLLDWLQQESTRGVVVQTVRQVVGGVVQPAVAGPGLPAAPNGSNTLRNASFEYQSVAALPPDCWQLGGYGGNTSAWTWTSDAHSGSHAERVDVTNYSSGDQKVLVQLDLGGCTPSVTPGRQYRITAWYKSTTSALFTVFRRDGAWVQSYWVSSPRFAAAAAWTQASWVTPVIPPGVNGLDFGLAIGANGTLIVDDASIDDAAPTGATDTSPPTVTLTAPSDGATVGGVVDLSATASDDTAVDHVDFLVDGIVVGSTTVSPYTRPWDSRAVADGTHTVTARAVDPAGNSAVTSPVSVVTSNQSPNLLKNPSLESASGGVPTCWILGGYGANTFTWARTTDAHSGSFAERLDMTGWTSGDRKLVIAQDSGACATPIVAGRSYVLNGWYKSSAQPSLFVYYRTSSGAWVYWTQSPALPTASGWTKAAWTTPPVPSGATHLSVGLGLKGLGSLTMDDFSMAVGG